MEKFIAKGVETIDNFIKNKENHKELEIRIRIAHGLKILQEIEQGVFIKRNIFKDATASCYQHMVKILGAKNIDSLTHCNMNSLDTWYDPYVFIKEKFLNNIKCIHINEEELPQIFNRKRIKKLIMTETYGASEPRCEQDFLESIEKDKFSPEQYEEIVEIFKKFYTYLKGEEGIFKNKTNAIHKHFKGGNLKQVFYDGSIIRHEYYKPMAKQVEFYTENKRRRTKQETVLDNNLFVSKMRTSIKANYVQSIDAALARWFILQGGDIVIHDCFTSDYINATHLVSRINSGMRIVFHDIGLETNIEYSDIYSPFIIL